MYVFQPRQPGKIRQFRFVVMIKFVLCNLLVWILHCKAFWHLQSYLVCHTRKVLPLALLGVHADVVRHKQVLGVVGMCVLGQQEFHCCHLFPTL